MLCFGGLTEVGNTDQGPGDVGSVYRLAIFGHPAELLIVKCSELCLVAGLGAIAACGGANAGPLIPAGEGGAGGAPPTGQGVFRLNCEFRIEESDTVELNLPIELFVELTEPFSRTDSTEATFSASLIFNEEESVASLIEALINAGDPTAIDIVSASVTTNVTGATPDTMTASLGGTPIRFDLEADPDDDGLPGPHRLDFDSVTVTANATPDATEVLFGLDFRGVSLVLGNVNIPSDCISSPSLGGVALRFPVGR